MASEVETKSPGGASGDAGPHEAPGAAPPGATAQAGARLGGARADFVASLGRKLLDARAVLAALEADPASRSPRDELRRKLHALGAGARMLHFDAMARCIAEATAVLDHAAEIGKASDQDLLRLAQALLVEQGRVGRIERDDDAALEDRLRRIGPGARGARRRDVEGRIGRGVGNSRCGKEQKGRGRGKSETGEIGEFQGELGWGGPTNQRIVRPRASRSFRG